jgi:quinoprotein dehydrogenase-associated probable ABC transporter substrate-binding protein
MFSHYPEAGKTSRRSCLRWLGAAALTPLLAKADCLCSDGANGAQTTAAIAPASAGTLRICADANNLPFSNRYHEGFEDRVAELIARELNMSLEYEWLPQRLGFYRTALKTFNSDMVMAAPGGFDKALITNPYYKSSYVFVYRSDEKHAPTSCDDPHLRAMKIGVQLANGDTPPTHALAKRKIIDNVTGYPVFDESTGKPAEKIINAVAIGEIDVALVWGPQAGYFVRQHNGALTMKVMTPAIDGEGAAAMPFTFSICMALRRPDTKLRDAINEIIPRRQKQIDQILDDFAVPRLPLDINRSIVKT